MCGVIDDKLEVIQQQNVYACGGGNPCSILKESDKWGQKGDVNRDIVLMGGHFIHPLPPLIIKLFSVLISMRGGMLMHLHTKIESVVNEATEWGEGCKIISRKMQQ